MTNNSRVLNTKKNLIPKLDVEKKNKDYKLKNKNIDSKKISQIEIRKKDNLIEISKNDEVILKTKIDQEIKSRMGEASYAKTDGYRISWTESVQNRIDTKMLKQAEPQTYERYLKQVNSRRFSVQRTAA